MNHARSAVSVLLTWLTTAFQPAIAQQTTPAVTRRVQLEVKDCPDVSIAVVRRIVNIEIGDLLLESGDGEATPADHLIIRCAGNLASVEATGSSAQPPTERILRLDEFPGDAAPRALALLGVELLAARNAAVRERILRRQTPSPPAAVETAPVPRTASPPAGPVREVRLGATGAWRTFLVQNGASLLGGRLQATSTATKPGGVAGDLEVAAGGRNVASVGETSLLLISSSVSFGLWTGRHTWRAGFGVGGRIGLFRESGRSADVTRIVSSTFMRPWGGPIVNARLSRNVGPVALTVNGEAGWSLLSSDEIAVDATAASTRGPWLAVSIGTEVRVR